ncbi:MAG: CoA pyrophosphatase [Halieaceae bacterium]|jgi:8-oxo-dGTP pyrophosphatase MutT (NUDIX family)|nr:CoA pyrophosphatase [Halieaceae bacterium]
MAVLHGLFERLDRELPLRGLAWEGPFGKTREAAVLVALTTETAPRVILGRRAMHLPLHPGEVAFPGGKREPADLTPWVTALRESNEEIGLDSDLAEPLGELSPLITRTGFDVHPCVARVPAGLELVVDPREFDSVFMLPLELFADRDLFRLEAMSDGVRTRMVPHYQVGDDNIWGVTAAVLAQLVNLAFDAGLDLQRNWTVTP